MNVVAFSLYGDEEIYFCGALENIRLVNKLLPGWTVRIYAEASIGEVRLRALRREGASVIEMQDQQEYSPMFWRFLAVFELGIQRAIFRDADSRITQREVQMIRDWVGSGMPLHIIRDHPFHALPILGGMWGVQGRPAIDKVAQMLRDGREHWGTEYGADQNFLASSVYPSLWSKAYVHDAFFNFERRVNRPPVRVQGEFVGERIECSGAFDQTLRLICQRVESHYVLLLRTRLLATRLKLRIVLGAYSHFLKKRLNRS